MTEIWRKLRGVRQLPLLGFLALIAILMLLNLGAPNQMDQSLEGRVAAVLASVEGAGAVKVLIEPPSEMDLGGALIVAQGAGDIAVALKLQRAAKALLSMPIERIEVLPMQQKGGWLW